MSAEGMPPLPPPSIESRQTDSVMRSLVVHSYDANDMRAYGRLVAQACAGICRDMACGGSAFNSAAMAIEAAIRKRFNLEQP